MPIYFTTFIFNLNKLYDKIQNKNMGNDVLINSLRIKIHFV